MARACCISAVTWRRIEAIDLLDDADQDAAVSGGVEQHVTDHRALRGGENLRRQAPRRQMRGLLAVDRLRVQGDVHAKFRSDGVERAPALNFMRDPVHKILCAAGDFLRRPALRHLLTHLRERADRGWRDVIDGNDDIDAFAGRDEVAGFALRG